MDSEDFTFPEIVSNTIRKSKCGFLPYQGYKASCLDWFVNREIENNYYKNIDRIQNALVSFLFVPMIANSIRCCIRNECLYIIDFTPIASTLLILEFYNINPLNYIYRFWWYEDFSILRNIEKNNVLHELLLGGLIYESKAYGGTWHKDEGSHGEGKHIVTDFSRLNMTNIDSIENSYFQSGKCIEAEVEFDLGTLEKVRFKICSHANKNNLRIIHPLTINHYILLPELNLDAVTEMAIRFRVNAIKYSIMK